MVQPNLVLSEIAGLVPKVLPPGISMEVDVPAELWPIAGDPGEIHQALINVLLNARATVRKTGHITLSARNATVDEVPASSIFDARAGNYVEVGVSCTGFDIHPSSVDADIGLRLVRVARVLRNHGGFARIESRAGQPTTISLYFPRAEIASDSVADRAQGGTGSILIVDDEDAILDLSQEILARAGHSVLVARNGREALALFWRRRSDIGLLLTDLMMPGMNGFTLVWALRRSKPALRVLVSTGHDTEDNRRELERIGVRHVLAKPFTQQQMLDAVSRAVAEPVQCEPQLFLAEWAASQSD